MSLSFVANAALALHKICGDQLDGRERGTAAADGDDRILPDTCTVLAVARQSYVLVVARIPT